MKRISPNMMNQHLGVLTYRLNDFLGNVPKPVSVGHIRIKTIIGNYMRSTDISTTIFKGDRHRIGPVRYCVILRGIEAVVFAFYKTVCIRYTVDGMREVKDVRHFHQFTMDILDIYYDKHVCEETY